MNTFRYMTTIVLSTLIIAVSAHAELRVVATISTFADLTETIGGDHVSVERIVPPTFNPHFIDAKPSDVLDVKRADAFVHAGLDLEVWKAPLLNAAGNPAASPGGTGEINMSSGIRLLNVPDRTQTRAEGDIHLFGNPHYWLDPNNGLIMARTVASRLSEIDPQNASDYQANLEAFEARMQQHLDTWQKALANLDSREVVAYHDQWPYLLEFCGVEATQFVEPKPGIPPGPKHLRSLSEYIQDNDVPAIIWSAVYPAKSVKALSKLSGAPVVQLAQGVGEVDEASDYIALIDYNVRQISNVLSD